MTKQDQDEAPASTAATGGSDAGVRGDQETVLIQQCAQKDSAPPIAAACPLDTKEEREQLYPVRGLGQLAP